MDQFARTSLLIGKDAVKKLCDATVAIFGLGGVGSYVVEGLARAGVGNFVLVDNDAIDETNINRQIIALHSTLGQDKVLVAKNRILDINPGSNIAVHKIFYSKDSSQEILDGCDYVVDAIDTISAKIALVEECAKRNLPIISAMGAGNRLDPTLLEVADIFKTSVCPVCRVMRTGLKKRGISSLKVVYSKEKPITPDVASYDVNRGDSKILGSTPFVPAVAGLILAIEVVKDIISSDFEWQRGAD